MWNRYLALLMMATLLRLDYELNQPQEIYTDRFALPQPGNQSLAVRQKEWSEKAVKKYTEAQEKKWHRWNEAMFERES
jgi:hypothetical protein